MPRIDELPLPAQSEICAAQQKEGKDGHPDKRRTSLMQRLASVGLSRKAEKGGPVRANAASRTFDPRNSSVHPAADSRSVSHNSIDEDVLDSPAWPPSELSPASSPVR
jgi:cell division protein FtsZ